MRRGVRILTGLTITAAVAAGAPAAAYGADNPYERGPNPTENSIEASRGPFSVSQATVSRSAASGFGGGTIYYPTSTSEGTFGALAISPGFTADQSTISWMGPRLASQGFVVITIDTLSTLDQPDSRGDQLRAALSYLSQRSSVRTRIDATRLAVAGHSMGGGGSLEAAKDQPSLQAAIPIAGWHNTKNWSSVRVPTFVIGGENDSIASVDSHSIPFYNSIPASSEKAFMELDGEGHLFPLSANTTMAKYMISWLKRFVDNDTRYEQFLCPAPDDRAISDYRDTCPHS
jgi:pimeloyl-ACP methyl ester carboxylesterase